MWVTLGKGMTLGEVCSRGNSWSRQVKASTAVHTQQLGDKFFTEEHAMSTNGILERGGAYMAVCDD